MEGGRFSAFCPRTSWEESGETEVTPATTVLACKNRRREIKKGLRTRVIINAGLKLERHSCVNSMRPANQTVESFRWKPAFNARGAASGTRLA